MSVTPADRVDEVRALRRSAVVSRLSSVSLLRMPVDAGLSAIDSRVATNLELRESQFRQALALDDGGRPRADLLVGVFRGALYALVWGGDRAAHTDVLGVDRSADIGGDFAVIGLDGPFAWEVLGGWDTQTAIGLPYLSAYAPREGTVVVRAGRTGEYGYLVIVPRAQVDAVWADLLARVQAFEGRAVSEAALAHASLENWVYDLDRCASAGLDALELQLTWRLDLRKQSVGMDAIRAHRERGVARRIVAIDADAAAAPGTPVLCDGGRVGSVVAAALRVPGPGAAVVGALDVAYAETGLDVTIDGRPARTRSAPFLLNRSLFVNPQRHVWATRAEIELPPGSLWPGTTSW